MVATTANGMAKIVHQLCDERDRLRAELSKYEAAGKGLLPDCEPVAGAGVCAAFQFVRAALGKVAADLAAKEARIAELEDHAVLATLAKNNDELRARIAELEACLRKAYGRLAGTEVYPSRLVREEIVEVLKEVNP